MTTHENADYGKLRDEIRDRRIEARDAVEARVLGAVPCKRCEQPAMHRWRGLCARCYLHAGGV